MKIVFPKIELKSDTTLCVIGLGRFGSAISEKILELNKSLIMIDINYDKLENLPDLVKDHRLDIYPVDSTNELELRKAGVKEVDIAIVAIGDDVQSNILTAITLKEMGIPIIIAKAHNKLHGRLLARIGIDHVVYPEFDAASNLLQKMTAGNLNSLMHFNDDEGIVAIRATKKILGKNVRELGIRERFGCNVIAFQKDKTLVIVSDGTEIIDYDHDLIVIGKNEKIKAFQDYLMNHEEQ